MKKRTYRLTDGGMEGAVQEPDYARVARSLSDTDLRDELERGRGTASYRAALRAELARRSR